ncbi:flagellar biosynthetic protein FliO [Peribacillus sp. SCS-155]|uniref:flagellar biosynthetic protein FliO n=1 Tax=Peribacillus sedimenti TaxID=3115297 RepID=UPI003905E72F
MHSIKKSFRVLLLFLLVFQATSTLANSEGLDGSVKDHFNNTEKKENKTTDDTTSKETVSDSGSAGLGFLDFLRMILATLFVVGLLYFLLRFINKKNRSYQKANFIENIGGTSLGSNRSVQMIKVGKRILIVGVGENIELLKEIDDESEYQDILSDFNNRLDGMLQPSDIFTRIQTKLVKPDGDKTHFSSQFKKQLEEFSEKRKRMIDELEKKGSHGE